MESAQAPSPLIHVLIISFPAQGHVNPMLCLAKRIAAKGLLVTFSSTRAIGRKIAASTGASEVSDGVPYGRGRLRLEFLEDGMHGDKLDEMLSHIRSVGSKALAELIGRQADHGRPVSCVVNNCFLPWVVDVAAALGIPCGVLWVQSCALFRIYHHAYRTSVVEFPADVELALSGIPALSAAEVPTFLLQMDPADPHTALPKIILAQLRCLDKASWVFGNSFDELEHDAIVALADLGERLITVGPLVEVESGVTKNGVRADLLRAADDCVSWLDAQALHSVVYVSLGSVVKLSKEEMAEMVFGLKIANRPFLWVVRPDCRELLPKGLADEVMAGGRGMIVEWSPQERVLAHPATGCFLTHCGWNSSLETIYNGVPVIAYPQFGDQVTNAKFLVDVWRVGVHLPPPVHRDAFRDAAEAVMDGPDAPALRQRAKKLLQAARAATTGGGSSDCNIQAFIDELRRRARVTAPCDDGSAARHDMV